MKRLLTLTLLLMTNSAFAAPVPASELAHTPAGRWLLEALGEGQIGALEEKLAVIQLRYKKSVDATDGIFGRAPRAAVTPEKGLLLELIAREELGEGVRFVDASGSPSNRSARELLSGQTPTAMSYRGVGTFRDSGGEMLHLIERPLPWSGLRSPSKPWEKTLERLLNQLGVRFPSGHVAMIPSVSNLNARIAELNRSLARLGYNKIPVRFVESSEVGGTHVARLLANGEVPIRLRGYLGGRDPIITLGATLLSPQQLKVIHADFGFLKAFQLHFQTASPSLSRSSAGRGAFKQLWDTLAFRIGGWIHLHIHEASAIASLKTIGLDAARGRMLAHSPEQLRTPLERIGAMLDNDSVLVGNPALRRAIRSELEVFARSSGAELNVEAFLPLTSPNQALDMRISEIDDALRIL